MQQTKIESLIEACINVFLGFLISVLANFIIFPIVGLPVSTGQILAVGGFMTAVSVIRSYLIRRFCQDNLRKIIQYMLGAF